ncbi:hypothetical protein vfu_B00048 [Vibrio furnissii NCTC 11218]|nr:hypothetical protein vfu_B00048 [Vibrio furnissii NCTC 11218]
MMTPRDPIYWFVMIESIYQHMWDNFCDAMRHNRYVQDPYLTHQSDTRRGITALAYLQSNSQFHHRRAPHDESRHYQLRQNRLRNVSPLECLSLTANIEAFLDQFRTQEPEQYYYPQNELHITLLSVISCVAGFQLADIDVARYAAVFQHALRDIEPIDIEFRGVTASPECIVIQGFPQGNGLNALRERLRDELQRSGLPTTADSRYKLVTAHASAVRFRAPLNDTEALLQLCQRYRHHVFGRMTLSACELVFNNWYQQRSVTQSLAQCVLLAPVGAEK